MKKITRITSDCGDGARSLIQVEAVAVREELYKGDETTMSPFDIVTVTVKSANLITTHTFYGVDGGYGGFGKTFLPDVLPLPLQEDERFEKAARQLMEALVDLHITQIKQMAEILPVEKEKGHLNLINFESLTE